MRQGSLGGRGAALLARPGYHPQRDSPCTAHAEGRPARVEMMWRIARPGGAAGPATALALRRAAPARRSGERLWRAHRRPAWSL